MRKLTILEYITLDGIIQAPGGLKLVRTRTGASGVMVHTFEPAGPLRTGTFGQDTN